MKSRKIIYVKTHENVKFDGKQDNHFYSYSVNTKPMVEISLIEDLGCVEIKNERDHAIIPLVNIAYLKLDSPLAKKKREQTSQESKKPKSTLQGHQIKKPR